MVSFYSTLSPTVKAHPPFRSLLLSLSLTYSLFSITSQTNLSDTTLTRTAPCHDYLLIIHYQSGNEEWYGLWLAKPTSRLPSMLISCSLRDTDSNLSILALQQGEHDSASCGQFHSHGKHSIVTCSHHECDQSAISVSTKAASANRFLVIAIS